ncbi:MAG: ATP-binding protein [Algicola sp.]|nr:ATP-binding protein [Algicola sp.]
MNTKRIVITGGPGTGKTSLINELKNRGFICFDEVSRDVILEARKEGVEQLFLTNPLLFSERLLKGRQLQFKAAETATSSLIFLDRGIPDVLAYMEYANETYPQHFIETSKNHRYDAIFVLAPWETIFESDNERYENFQQAEKIHEHLLATYKKLNYALTDVPFDSIENRANFLLEKLNLR